MSDLLKKKLEIAKQAGKLDAEIVSLNNMIEFLKMKRHYVTNGSSGDLSVKFQRGGNAEYVIDSYYWDPKGTGLHDALIGYLHSQLDKRMKDLDDLIKVMQ